MNEFERLTVAVAKTRAIASRRRQELSLADTRHRDANLALHEAQEALQKFVAEAVSVKEREEP